MEINKETIDSITILKCIVGSTAYGFATVGSDIDTRGIAIPPKECILGFNRRFEQYEDRETDTVIYNIQKFFQLARDANPSILEILFVDDPGLVITETREAKLIKEHRNEFLSMKAG